LLKGTLAVQAGDFDSAQEHLEQVLALTPGSSPAMQQLAIINRLPLEAEQKLQDILTARPAPATGDRIIAGSALYRLLSRNGKPAEGFAALARGTEPCALLPTLMIQTPSNSSTAPMKRFSPRRSSKPAGSKVAWAKAASSLSA
jgi:Flp pilus assembly protein TadD